MTNSSGWSVVLQITSVALVMLLLYVAIIGMAYFYNYDEHYIARYKAETERLQLQQKLCTPENLVTKEDN